jgi:hypothetical protein
MADFSRFMRKVKKGDFKVKQKEKSASGSMIKRVMKLRKKKHKGKYAQDFN